MAGAAARVASAPVAMARKRKRKKKPSHTRSLGVVVCLTLLLALALWLWSLPQKERDDTVVWLQDVIEWVQDGFKEPFPSRLQSEWIADEGLLGNHLFAGLPQPHGDLRLLTKQAFMVGYDENRRNPAWVAYRIAGPAAHENAERPSTFSVDRQTAARVSHNDYSRSGYDRGHMAPNYVIATRYGRAAQEETFLMSNIVPQDPDLNQGPWRIIEEQMARRASAFDVVYVITGPIYDDRPEFLNASQIEIPDAFFKAAVGIRKGSITMIAFIAYQDVDRNTRIESLLTSVDAIEALTGYDLFADLPDDQEAILEAAARSRMW